MLFLTVSKATLSRKALGGTALGFLKHIGGKNLPSNHYKSAAFLKQCQCNNLMSQYRMYSQDNKAAAEKASEELKPLQQYSSILNEDILLQSGMDTLADKAGSGLESDKPKKKNKRTNKTSVDIKRERWANIFYLFLFAGTTCGGIYLARDWEEGENQHLEPGEAPIPNGYDDIKAIYHRFIKRWNGLFTVFSEPTVEKLLPDLPDNKMYRTPLTLVISLEDLLIHSEWDAKNGWRTAKRPGLEYFLLYLSSMYEIVLFSTNYSMYVEKTIQKLDPYNIYFSGALSKEAAKLKDGKVIKDLSLLNRDLGRVIIMDTDPDHYSLQPENALPIKPWDGSASDSLIRYIPFLEYVGGMHNIKDVRPILASFKDKDHIVDEFAAREQIWRQKWEKEHKNQSNWVASLLGLPNANKGPKFYLDITRQHNQDNYKRVKKLIETQIAEQEQKTKELMAAQKVTLGDFANSFMEGSNPSEMLAKQMAESQNKAASETK